MADDALRAATPVLRVVHAAAIKVLEENGVDTEKFGSRSSFLSTAVQDADAAEGGRLRRVGLRRSGAGGSVAGGVTGGCRPQAPHRP